MKRIISLLLVTIFLLSLAPYSFAASNEFDFKSVLGNRDGYEYDKFDKFWSFYKAYIESYSDAYVVIGMKAWGVDGGSALDYTELYVKILDRNGDTLHIPEAIDFLIGDDLYSYEEMLEGSSSSAVSLSQDGLLLIQALADCDPSDVSVKIWWDGSYITIDLDSSQLKSTLVEFCRVYTKYNIWDYCDDPDTNNMYESLYPLSINGEYIEHDEDWDD